METFQEEVRSIQIMELASQKVIRTIMPTEDRHWIRISNWLSEKILVYFNSNAGGADRYIYDIQKGLTEEADYNRAIWNTQDEEYSADGSLKVYGYGNIHLMDLKSKTDKIIFSQKSFFTHYVMSNDSKRIAIWQTEKIKKKYYGNVWIFDIKRETLERIFREEEAPGSGGRLCWSFDDRYIGIFSSGALVINIEIPSEIHRIKGMDFSWTNNNEIVYHNWHGENLHGIYLYNISSRKSNLLFDNAEQPIVLSIKNK